MPEEDRRQGTRIPVQMWVEERSPDGIYFQRSANLSAGGIFLEKTIPHPAGTVVNLEFTLPGESEALKVRAEIVNADTLDAGLGMGLRFVDLVPSQSTLIDRFIAKHGPR
jgi:uncharacterized protein (TIGR02266 family)